MAWLQENIGTALVCVGLALLVGGILLKLVKDHKKGKRLGCDCASCDACSSCGKE
ncbi:MAG: FeoB-associated Cys-rich membrane protein [Oscillospiraceae bacterium]|jgi:hypothetical protein|nr:FeoB-associated Cys-rich membrane protein [Oscillospiraceae bacterium]